MSTTTFKGGVGVEGLKKTLRAFSALDEDTQRAAMRSVQSIADGLANQIGAAARREHGKRGAFVANSVRGLRERKFAPVVKIGKAGRMPVSRRGQGPRSSDLMFGLEFGSDGFGPGATDKPTQRGGAPGWRFPEPTPNGTYIFPTLKHQQVDILKLWMEALDVAAAKWGE